jgi:HEPN domain-containing protein
MVTFNDAKKVAGEIVHYIKPLSIVVFESVAREGYGNDLDLFIVIDDSLPIKVAIDTLYKHLKPFYKYFAIDEFVVEQSVLQEHYEKGSPFINAIIKEGRSIYMKNAVQEGLRRADEELKTSLYLLEGGFFKGACYHAQQTIEKSIKANLISKGWDLEKTHNVNRLIALCNDFNIHLSLTDDEIVFIDSIYKGRYSADIGLLT